MADRVWKSSRTVALMLVGVAALAGPVSAMAQEREHIDHDIAQSGGGEREDGPRGRGNRSWSPAPAPQPAPQPALQAAQPPREDRSEAWRGRQSQAQPQTEAPRWSPPTPPPQAQVALPAPPPPPQRDAAPNRTYVDPARDRSYGADSRSQAPRQPGWGQQGWTGQTSNGNPPDRNANPGGPTYRQSEWRGEGQAERRPDNARRWDNERRRDTDRRWDNNRAPDWNSRGNNWSSRDDRNWSRQWRQDRRYNWQGWRSDHREVYRLNRYLPPYRSYAYRRLGIGFLLDDGFFASRYWIADPWAYRLPPVYGPFRWVRYYDDAVLVNIYNGEVVDVIYDVFW